MADMGIFAGIITQLNHLGFYGFILPWLLIFALVYGLIIKSKVLDAKPAGAVALAIAFFITAFSGIGNYFIALSGLGGMLFGALLIVVLFFALIGFDVSKLTEAFKGWESVAVLALIGIIIFFVLGGGFLSGIAVNTETMAAVFLVIVVAIAVIFVTK